MFEFWGYLWFAIALSVVLSLMFESPMIAIEKIVVDKGKYIFKCVVFTFILQGCEKIFRHFEQYIFNKPDLENSFPNCSVFNNCDIFYK